jgi:DNA-binding CsgD family transcriptional regulator
VVPARSAAVRTGPGLTRSTAHLSRRIVVTPRQAEILSLVARGMGDKEIAENLGVAPRTIRTHLERLFREYGLSSRSEAVAVWLRSKRR